MREKIINERIEAAWQKSRGEESYDPYYPIKASQNFIDGYMAGMAEKDKMIEWIATHHTGISSRTMWTALMMGVQPTSASPFVSYDIPYDAADFSLCYDLVSFCDINSAHDFPKITAVFPWYVPILDRWETLSSLYKRKQWDKFTDIMYEAISESYKIRNGNYE